MDALERMLGRIDRRLVYLGLAVFTLVPLVRQWDLPTIASQPVKNLYEMLDTVPPGKVVAFGIDWDAGTQPESRPQMLGMTRHLIRKNQKFFMISIGYPTSPQLSNDVVEEAVAEEKKRNPALDFQYGRDWVNLGYKEFTLPWLRGFTQDIQGQVQRDWKNRPLSDTFLAKVHRWGRSGEIAAFVDVTGSKTADYWRPLLFPQGVSVGLSCTAVMAPEQYPFLANRQVVGMLTGLKGAAEYEQQLGYRGRASRQMTGQSFAHLYILLLLVLGNIAVVSGMLRRRNVRRRRVR